MVFKQSIYQNIWWMMGMKATDYVLTAGSSRYIIEQTRHIYNDMHNMRFKKKIHINKKPILYFFSRVYNNMFFIS